MPREGRRRRMRNRAAELSSSPEASPLSRLRRCTSCPRRRGRATGTHPCQPSRRLPHLERNQSTQIATTSSLYFTSLLRRPSAWAHQRQAKSVHVFVHTHIRRLTPWCATAELAAVAKPLTCLRAQVRTWTPPLAGQCSLMHARAKASPFCGQTSCEFKPSPPTFSSSPGKPRS
jgi:hypothetical protein